MKALLLTLALTLAPGAAGASTAIPCKATLDDWIKAVPAGIATKTCQLFLARSYKEGACHKKEQYWDGTNWIEHCVSWQQLSWTKTAELICGGQVLLKAGQTCTGQKMDRAQLNKTFEAYDYSLRSIFIEQLAQQDFAMTGEGSSGNLLYFTRR